MKIDEILGKVGKGEYDVIKPEGKILSENTIIDEDKTVRWNRDEVARLNEEYRTKMKEYYNDRKNAELRFKDDMIRAGIEDGCMNATSAGLYPPQLTYETVEKAWDFAYKEFHGSGMADVVSYFTEIITIIAQCVVFEIKNGKSVSI